MIGRLLFFIGVTAAAGVAAAYLAGSLWGDDQKWGAIAGVCVCLLPATVTLLISEWSLRWPPEYQLVAILGGSGLRIVVVALWAFALFQKAPPFGEKSGLWTWVLVFYGVTLALEVAVVLRAQAKNRPAAKDAHQPVNIPVSTAE
ncbi:MAG TPA: hypothetical protein VKD72_24740 [Gemmataceae bacterium]|nr:hypothetical protein [Gemmataceae bacterium]